MATLAIWPAVTLKVAGLKANNPLATVEPTVTVKGEQLVEFAQIIAVVDPLEIPVMDNTLLVKVSWAEAGLELEEI